VCAHVRRIVTVVYPLAVLLAPAPSVLAQTSLTWTGGGGPNTNWTNVANWGGSAYPNNGQPNPGYTYNVAVNSGTPTLNVNVVVNNFNLMGNGTVGGSGDLTINGEFTWFTGTLQGAGTTFLNGGGSLSGVTDRAMVNGNGGTLTVNGLGADVATGALTNQAGAAVVLASNATMLGPGTFFNNGSVQNNNNATINWTFNNAGTVAVTGGMLTLSGSGTDTGIYTVAPAATLRFNGGTRSGTVITGGGTLSLETGANLTAGGATVGTLSVSGATATFNGPVTAASAGLSFSSTTVFNGPTTLGSLTMDGTTVDGTGDVTVNGAFHGNGGKLNGTGTMTLASGGTIAGMLLGRPVLNGNGGTVSLGLNGGIASSSANAVWTNQAGATLSLGTYASLGTNGGVGTFLNSGTLQKTGPTTGNTSNVDWVFVNAGTVSVLSGTLALNNTGGTGLDTGSYGVNSGGTLAFTPTARSTARSPGPATCRSATRGWSRSRALTPSPGIRTSVSGEPPSTTRRRSTPFMWWWTPS
jgi:hypothetical protein